MSAHISSLMNASTTDASKVRLGAYTPALSTTDAGKVRLGAYAPTLPLGR